MNLKKATSEQLLSELISREGYSKAPTSVKFYSDYQEATIGIGNDNTAYIFFDLDDKEALDRMNSYE